GSWPVRCGRAPLVVGVRSPVRMQVTQEPSPHLVLYEIVSPWPVAHRDEDSNSTTAPTPQPCSTDQRPARDSSSPPPGYAPQDPPADDSSASPTLRVRVPPDAGFAHGPVVRCGR